jgi:hypothetical protein
LISFKNQEGKDRIRNQLNYLKKTHANNFQSFFDLCLAHDIDPSNLEPRCINFDSVSFSDNNVSDQDAKISDNNDESSYKQHLNETPSKQTSKIKENKDIGELIVIQWPVFCQGLGQLKFGLEHPGN